jgi:hypothetical protein
MLSDQDYLGHCLAKMHMARELVERVATALHGAAILTPRPTAAGG